MAIHLWNRRPGREIAVGSLRWLAAGANRRLRNLKPEQLWLLLLRATLLAVLAVVLAGPVWQQAQPAGRGQVLVSPKLIGTPALGALRPAIDSLGRRGYALRWLAADFPKMSPAALWADSVGQRDSARALTAATKTAGQQHWSRVQQATQTFAGQPLYVLTPATLRDFGGTQPHLPATVTWQPLPTGASDTWLQAAAVRGDSLRLLVGKSSESQTSFRITSVARPRPGGVVRVAGLPALQVVAGAAGDQLRPLTPTADTAAQAIAIRSQPIRIVIYATPAYAADARYLQAGLRAASVGLLAPLALSTTASLPGATNPPDWLFWLGDTPLPTAWTSAMNQGTQIWRETAGPGTADQARLTVTSADEVPATIFRRGPSVADSNVGAAYPVWTDGRGRPVLARQPQGQGALYSLATRLSPTWSDLADNPTFPARLLALLQPEMTDAGARPRTPLDAALAAHDQRALDPAQLQLAGTTPAATASAVAVERPGLRQTDLRPWLVLAALLLFAFERLLAHRRESQSLTTTAL